MGIMECHIQEERSILPPCVFLLSLGLEKPSDQQFDPGNIPTHLEHRIVFLCVGEVKGVDRTWTNVLLPDYPCVEVKERTLSLCGCKRERTVNNHFECEVSEPHLHLVLKNHPTMLKKRVGFYLCVC